jgi:uncharacterized cupin superfamily protein
MTDIDDLALTASTALVGSLLVSEAPWPSSTEVPNPVTGSPRAALLPLVDDGLRSAGLWRCTPGSFRSDHTGYVEVMHVVEGAAELRGHDGTTWRVSPGTVLVVPDGWIGTWVVEEDVVKSYAIFKNAPR